MSWIDSLNSYGLSGTPPPAQTTTMQVTNQQASGVLPANQVVGPIVTRLQVGDATNPDACIYIDYQGIYAGSAVFADAPASISILGDAKFTTASIQTGTTGQRVFIGEFMYANGTVEGIQIWNTSGDFVGVIYGSTSGITIADNNTPGANEFLTLDQTDGNTYLGGYNNTDVSAQLGNLTLSAGAGSPQPYITISTTNGIGFFGFPGTLQPTITGSTAGNVALENLLSALADMGLVIDSTT